MDKGWGLTLDSDSLGFFLNKPPPTSAVNNKRTNPFAGERMFTGIEFPVKPRPADDSRVAVDEVDFFSDKNNKDDHREQELKSNNNNTSISVKKEKWSGLDAVNVSSYTYSLIFSFFFLSIFGKIIPYILSEIHFISYYRLACTLLLQTPGVINRRWMMVFHLIMRIIEEQRIMR